MKRLRLPFIVLLVAGLLLVGYFWAYKTSSMGWVSETRRPVLRMMGMNLDYTEDNGRRFSAFFKPLIERDYRNSTAESVEGTFNGIGSNTGGLSISRSGKMGMSIQFGPEHDTVVKGLAKDTEVKIWYKQKSIPENPFSYHYYLTDLMVTK